MVFNADCSRLSGDGSGHGNGLVQRCRRAISRLTRSFFHGAFSLLRRGCRLPWCRRMDKFALIVALIVFAVLEMVALIVVARLWLRRRHHIVPRILWTFVLLIPVLGLLMYGFLSGVEPQKHPDRMDSQADADAFMGGGGGLGR